MFRLPFKGQLSKNRRPQTNRSRVIDIIDIDELKRRKAIKIGIIAIIAIIAIVLVVNLSVNEKTSDTTNTDKVENVNEVTTNVSVDEKTYPFPESITLNDSEEHVLYPMVDISDYYNELKSLLEEYYQTDVLAIKLYSCLNGNSSIQYLVWYNSTEDNYEMDQFASATITQYLQENCDSYNCNKFTSGFYDGVFIIYET